MIAYQSTAHGDKVDISNDRGEGRSCADLDEALWFLMTDHPYQFRVAWDLDEFVAPILNYIPHENLVELNSKGRTRVNGQLIVYNQGSNFAIFKGPAGVYYYHLKQFYPKKKEPDTLVAVRAKGEKLLEELDDINVHPTKLSSPIALFESTLLELIDNRKIPNWRVIEAISEPDVPDVLGQMAWECCDRLWTEAHKIGHFPETTDLDINACFGSIAADLYDFRYGDWTYGPYAPKPAVYGFADGTVSVSSDISPLAHTDAGGKQYHPRNSWNTVLTLREIRLLDRLGIGKFDIRFGWWFTPRVRKCPLDKLMNSLYKKRSDSDLMDLICKRAINGLYGRMKQVYSDGTFAPLFNPVWAAIIEAEARCKVMEFVVKNKLERRILHMSTDGVLIEGDFELPNENGRMGSWRVDSKGPALIVGSGLPFYGEKRTAQLSYKEAMELVQDNPDASQWEKSFSRRTTLGDRMSLDGLGKQGVAFTGFRLKGKDEHDRYFKVLPETGKELLDNVYRSKALVARKA